MNTAIILSPALDPLSASLYAPTLKANRRVAEFFTTQINNDHTRKAYLNVARRFSAWCEEHGIQELSGVEPIHIAAFVKFLEKEFSAPTVKQHLAALRMLFDWLVTGHVLEMNPAHAVRGPKYIVRKGKTPVLSPEEIRQLLDSIEAETLMGLRDRALIALMTYTFARVGAAIKMRVEDYFVQGRRSWVRLREKGGKQHEVPCHHRLDEYLHAYIQGAGLESDPKGFLFRSMASKAGKTLTRNPLFQQHVHTMIRNRAAAAKIKTPRVGCHSLRATGITAYMKNGGRLEVAQQIANHESPRTTKLYDRSSDEISLDEIERIAI
jgi:site-specific recombinase XerD